MMKKTKHPLRFYILFGLSLVSISAFATTTDITGTPLIDGILSTIIYGFIGIFMALVGYKMVDWLTPGNLHKQIAEDENRALATLAGSMIIGVCLIIAAVLIG